MIPASHLITQSDRVTPPVDPPTVWVTIGQEEGFLLISVKDNGIGLAHSRELGSTAGTGTGLRSIEGIMAEYHQLYGEERIKLEAFVPFPQNEARPGAVFLVRMKA